MLIRRLLTLARCLGALLAAPWHRHRLGSPFTIYRGEDGWAYYPCASCSRPVRLTAVWASALGTTLPSRDAQAWLACDKLETATDEATTREHAEAVAACREAAGLEAAGGTR